MTTRLRADQLKRYSLELYGPGGAEDLLWKVDSDDPFTPMNRGDRLQPLDLEGAHPGLVHEITGIEHVIWTAGEQVRYVTRVYTRPAEPLG
ncbi:hypothetical protein [Phenylobacterium sp.]|jgi:hypothetical protein|uniref:hypothetical protein n=1 Tax=Phenylobacterium sp. TaxID=1871053 RepID=UPI002F9505E2